MYMCDSIFGDLFVRDLVLFMGILSLGSYLIPYLIRTRSLLCNLNNS